MTITNILLGLMLAATLADHVSTNAFLKGQGLREGNPLLARVIARWGSRGLFVIKAALYLFVLALHYNWLDAVAGKPLHLGPLPNLFLAACVGVFAAAAAWNFYKISTREQK